MKTIPLVLAVHLFFFVHSSMAGNKFWDFDGGTAGLQSGAGTWDAGTTAAWSTASGGTALTTWASNDDAFFQTGGANAVTVNGTVLANSVRQSVNGTAATINSGIIQIQTDTGFSNTGNQNLTIGSTVTLNSSNVSFTSATGGNISFSAGIGQTGGTRGISVNGTTGIVTFSGATANTYAGMTTISGGSVLSLSKTAGVNAVAGDISISSGGRIQVASANQIINTANVTMSGAGSVYNGTGINTGAGNVNETIASLTVTGGSVNSGSAVLTVTGALSLTGGAGNTYFVGNSGGRHSFGSLSLTGMSAVESDDGLVNTPNTFTVYGNSGTLSSVTVGSGGLTLDSSRLNLRRASTAGFLGSKLVLNGNVTTTGSSSSMIAEDVFTGGTIGTISVELSSSAGSVTRTITTGGGGANLSVGVPIVNGAATTAGITKDGAGTLTFSAANTYNGATTINNGVLLANNTTGSGTGAGSVTVSGGTLGGTGSISGAVSVGSAGTLLGGNGVAAMEDLALSGNVSLASGSKIQLTLGASGAHSSLTRTGGTWTFDSAQGFAIVDAGLTTGLYDNIIGGLAADPGTAGWTITNLPGYTGIFSFDGSNVDLTLIPEPATASILIAGAGCLLAGRRRHRE